MDKVKPIEDFVFEGLSKRIQQVFQCICIHTSSNDKTKALERVFEGRSVQYPYIFMIVQTLGPNTESYATNRMARRGLLTTVHDGFAQAVRMMPANFEIQIEYVTNKFQSVEQGSVIAFARRWLFARRCGYLKFNIKYGRLALWISSTLNDSVTIPELGNKVETESAYTATVNLTVHGYISEPDLGTQGIVQELVVNEVFVGADGSVPDSQFFAFNKEIP